MHTTIHAAAFITASYLDGLKAYNNKLVKNMHLPCISHNNKHPTYLLLPTFFAVCAAIKSINSGLKQS
jgi:hypothetical protein